MKLTPRRIMRLPTKFGEASVWPVVNELRAENFRISPFDVNILKIASDIYDLEIRTNFLGGCGSAENGWLSSVSYNCGWLLSISNTHDSIEPQRSMRDFALLFCCVTGSSIPRSVG